MNCTTCRYELSQCLDGRLPSGRRAVVLQHAAECSACGTFWAELQAAQQLTLRLRPTRVSPGFRDELWQRIQAGEGTPEAVFHEPVPLLAKLRYALTGAAAAAAAVLCVTWFGPRDDKPGLRPIAKADSHVENGSPVIVGNPAPNTRVASYDQGMSNIDMPALMTSTQRLGLNLVAREAAKQLDNRYASTNFALRRLEGGRTDAVDDVLENAHEFQGFGELLLDMRERDRLAFADAEIEADLRFAVSMLERMRGEPMNVQTVHAIVAPAFRRDRLASLSRKILLAPLDTREEVEALRHIKVWRPDILPKLFEFVANPDPRGFGMFAPGAPFSLQDECGEVWLVVPRSEAEGMLQYRIQDADGGQRRIEVRIGVPERK